MLYDGIQGTGNLAPNNSFWNQFGDTGGGMLPSRVDFTSLMQAAGTDANNQTRLNINPVYGNGYRSTVYSFNGGPDRGNFGAGGTGTGGGAPGSGGAAGGSTVPGSSASGLAGTSTGFGPSSLGLTGGGASGATGGVLGGANAAGGVTAGAGASGASGGFWGAAKGVLGNKALMSGLISGLSSAYGQWQQKSLAKDQYKYQSQELERYRQWQADQAERKRNSPSAQMSRALLAYYMPIMVERLGRHGRGGDTSALQEAMRNILGQGA